MGLVGRVGKVDSDRNDGECYERANEGFVFLIWELAYMGAPVYHPEPVGEVHPHFCQQGAPASFVLVFFWCPSSALLVSL